MPVTIDGTSGITTPTYNGTDTSEYIVPVTAFKNRIINGDMRIDQRNAGASVTLTASNVYNLDRWYARAATGSGTTAIQSTTVPSNYKNSLLITVGTGASPGATDNNYIAQRIEGLNMADFGWGTATASTITLSFWVRCSLTGTFGGAIQNSDLTRSYPFTYTISSANTWEQKSVTVAGDTSGTWLTTSGIGMTVAFDLGTGATYQGTAGAWASADYRAASGAVKTIATSGATFYITGVQLEAGTTATPFEQRLYGTELQLCQRYYEVLLSASGGIGFTSYYFAGSNDNRYTWLFKVTKRASASISLFSGASWGNSTPAIANGTDNGTFYSTSYFVASGATGGAAAIQASAEL